MGNVGGGALGALRHSFPFSLKLVFYGFSLAAFGIAVFAVLLWALDPWLPYWATYFASALLVYSVNYYVYSTRVFGSPPTLVGCAKYLAASSANVFVTSVLLVFLVDLFDFRPVPARVIVAIVLTPLAYLFHKRHTFHTPKLERTVQGEEGGGHEPV